MKKLCGEESTEGKADSVQALRTPCAFVVSSRDNVATLLKQVVKGEEIRLLGDVGERASMIIAKEAISSGHKIALTALPALSSITKYGYRIGHASRPITAGEWVHLHNCASDVDERSNTLDIQTGAPQDTKEAYV